MVQPVICLQQAYSLGLLGLSFVHPNHFLTLSSPLQNGDARAISFTHNFFKQIMWRSSKVDVAEELQIPPQEERVSWISLSPIEEHFYQRQYETCVGYAREIITSFKDVLNAKVPGCGSWLLHCYFL